MREVNDCSLNFSDEPVLKEMKRNRGCVTLKCSGTGPDVRDLRMDDIHRLWGLVSIPMLPAAIDDPTDPAFQDETRPGVGGQPEPAVLLSRRGLGNDQISPSIEITTERLFKVLQVKKLTLRFLRKL